MQCAVKHTIWLVTVTALVSNSAKVNLLYPNLNWVGGGNWGGTP